jgi:hypothetical protein
LTVVSRTDVAQISVLDPVLSVSSLNRRKLHGFWTPHTWRRPDEVTIKSSQDVLATMPFVLLLPGVNRSWFVAPALSGFGLFDRSLQMYDQ